MAEGRRRHISAQAERENLPLACLSGLFSGLCLRALGGAGTLR